MTLTILLDSMRGVKSSLRMILVRDRRVEQ
jgi:hypothetical protein